MNIYQDNQNAFQPTFMMKETKKTIQNYLIQKKLSC